MFMYYNKSEKQISDKGGSAGGSFSLFIFCPGMIQKL